MSSRSFLLPFFIIKLLVVNIPFLLNIIFYPIHQYKNTIFVSILFFLYSLFLLNNLQKNLFTPKISPKKFTPTSSIYKIKTCQDLVKINEIKNNLEKLTLLSPTTRNISLNLALISFYQNSSEKFSLHWSQAKVVDPNNPLFSVSPQ